MNFVVYRGSWLRGTEKSRLLNRLQKQCCMGQVAVQCGVPLEELEKRAFLCCVDSTEELMRQGLLRADGRDQSLVNECYRVNDVIRATDGEMYREDLREAVLTNLMVSLGHNLRFQDGVAPWFELEEEDSVELVEEELVPA